MADKKKGIEEIFEEEFFDLPATKAKKTVSRKAEDVKDIFEDFAPAPVDEVKRKKKVSEDILEDFLASPKKEPEVKKPPERKEPPKPKVSEVSPFVEEKKATSSETVLDEFIIPPPAEEPPRESVKPSPPPPVKEERISPPPPPKVEKREVVTRAEVPQRRFLAPFLMGFASGVIVSGIFAGMLFFTYGKKELRETSVTVKVSEKKVEQPEKVSVPPQSTGSASQPSPSVLPEASSPKPEISEPSPPTSPQPPPPPPQMFVVTISDIKGDEGLRKVRSVLNRFNVVEASLSTNTVSKELYEVYTESIFSPAEANAAELKFNIMGWRYRKENEEGGIRYYFGPFNSAQGAAEMMQKLSQINYPGRIRITRSYENYYTVITRPVSSETADSLKRSLKGYKIKVERSS